MSDSNPSIPSASHQNATPSESLMKDLSENEAQISADKNASLVSEIKKSEIVRPSELGLPPSKIAKPTGLKLPSAGTPAPAPTRISRLCNNVPKPAIPPLPSPAANGTGFGGRGSTFTMSSIRKISDELARKRLTDVDEADENSVPFFGGGKWTLDRKMSSGSVLSDSSRKSSPDDLRKKRSSGASLSADSFSDYWKPDFEPRRSSDASVVLTEDTDQFIIGDRVWVGGLKPGQIAYIGETQFAPGEWAGIVLDEPIGKNDGTVANIRYFQCEPKKGIFSRLTRLTRYPVLDGAGEPAATKSYSVETRKSNGTLSASVPKKSPLISSPPPKNSISKPSSPDSAAHPGVVVGDRVIVKSSQGSKAGILRYMGTTDFAAGIWCGVELDDPLGKNDGSVSGTRYFECRPKFGLFAPLHKISKSPAGKRPPCVIHNRPGSVPGLRRQGSKESLVSQSSATSTAASLKSASRVRPSSTLNSSSQKIGVRAPTTPTSTKIALQETLKEKELHIEQLLKERDLERAEITRAASQADEAERQLASFKQEFEQQKEEAEARISDLDAMVCLLKSENLELANQLREEKTKYEDLQFRFEEESIEKGVIKSEASQHEERVNALEKMLAEERKKSEAFEQDSNKLFEAEEQMVILKDEVDTMKLELQDQKNLRSTIEQERISLEAHFTSARAEIESLKLEIQLLQASATEGQNNLTENLGKVLRDLEESRKEVEAKEKEIEKLSGEVHAKRQALDDKEKELHSKYLNIINELKGKNDFEVSSLNESMESLKNNFETKLKVLESQLEEKIKLCNSLEAKLNEQYISMSKTSEEKAMEQAKQKEKEEKFQEMLKNNLEELQKKDAQLVEEVAKSEKLLKETEKYQRELEEMKKICSLTSESTSKRVSDLNEILVKQKEELGVVREEVMAKQNECDELRQTVDKLKKEKEKKVNEVENITAEKESALKKSKEEYQQMKLEFNNKNQELKKLFDSHEEEFKAKIKNLEEAEVERQKDFENLTKNLESLKNSLEVRESEVRNEQINNKNLMTKFLALEENYKTTSEEKDQLQLENGDLIGRLQFAEEKLAETNNQKAKLEADISNFINSSNDSSHQLNKLNEDLRAKEKELDVMREEISQKSRNFERIEQELKQSLQKQETQIKTFQEDVEKMRQNHKDEIEILKSKIESSAVALKETQDECKKKIATSVTESATQIKDLEEKIRYLEKREVEDRIKYEENTNELLNFKNDLENKLKEAEFLGAETKKSLEKKIEELNMEKIALVETVEKTNTEFLTSEKNLLEKAKKESDQYACESEKLKNELKETHEKLETAIEELSKAKEEKNKLNEEKSKLETTSLAMEELLKQTQVKNAELEVNLASVESENKLLKETINQLREEKCNLDKDTTDKMLLVTELKSQLEALENSKRVHDEDNKQKMKSLQEEISSLKENLRKSDAAQSTTNLESSKIIGSLKLELEKLKQESSQMVLLKDKDIENINVIVRQLRKDLEVNVRESESKSKKISELEKNLQELKTKIEEEVRKSEDYGKKFDSAESEKLSLKEKLNEQSKLLLNSNELNSELEETRKKLAEAENRQQEMTNYFATEKRNLEKTLESTSGLLKERENEMKALFKEVEMLKLENVNLKNNNQILAQTWEKEKSELQRKVEASKQITQSTNANAESQEEMDEREFAKGQVDFLNSVIVDMQKKNDALKARIEILEMGFSPEDVDEFNLQNINPRNVAPRLFCDICDRFDLHDTEDCPTQAMDDDAPPPKPSKSKVLPPERPYCDICEVFGHDTADCDDAETF